MPYPWPASALTAADMRVLYHTKHRQSAQPAITRLIAEAIRKTYGAAPTRPGERPSRCQPPHPK